jgi:Putative MetA-pathway of phenol degradation
MWRHWRSCLFSVCSCIIGTLAFAPPSWAIEGNTAAGPIGGSDIRSAFLPPPGFYGGAFGLGSVVHDIKDGTGQTVAGSLLDIDFAITEHIGRFQVGVAGFYLFQVADDRQFGAIVPPDGRQVRFMTLGGVLNYDMPEYGAVFRVKALTTVIARNFVESQAVVLGFAKKLH